ncbi:uroporphyrinogen decarboxylase [Flavobacterium foetidum]|uniref:uroporphyrinogen decarboxylase n=1 Tax=Flavobacterium foetidum TaxID=2026681 RepID=UPI001074F428|nr:uroporphyrinogen decarboxylase [Flavobacterium foetidum]KAF2516567.1 uroporphyrinogen decarboxylase [Flavobacterium foetidum]
MAEYIGYLTSVFIVGGFMLKNLRTIRLINMFGCISFVIYGIFLNDYRDLGQWLLPVIIPNAILALVQVYYLTSKSNTTL